MLNGRKGTGEESQDCGHHRPPLIRKPTLSDPPRMTWLWKKVREGEDEKGDAFESAANTPTSAGEANRVRLYHNGPRAGRHRLRHPDHDVADWADEIHGSVSPLQLVCRQREPV